MRVAIDLQTDFALKRGHGSYVTNLVSHIKSNHEDVEIIPFRPPRGHKDLTNIRRLVWEQLMLPCLTAVSRADIIHQPAFSAPVLRRQIAVVTIHDVIALRFPDSVKRMTRFFFTKVMPFSYRFADHCITDSECSKRDILELLQLPAEKITVVPLAASSIYRPHTSKEDFAAIESSKARNGITGPYLIHLGTLEPRKNLPFLIRAYHKALRRGGPSYQLILAGQKAGSYPAVAAVIEELGLHQRVICTGYTEASELPLLLSGATALLFPSLYEGFGLPPLEAMQCGTPVLSSSASSLPEVVGEAGILLDPEDEAAWVEAIVRITTDEDLRTQLREAGLKQAKKFSWAKTAAQTVSVYRALLKQ